MNGYNYGYAEGPHIPPLDVDDALRYTPLTSVVPFSPNMVPLPSFTTSGSSVFQSEAERQHSRQALDTLNREAMQNAGSPYLRKCAHDITSQLAAVGADYRFKSLHDADSTPEPALASNLLRHPRLGKFGEIIASQSNVLHRYTSQPLLTSSAGSSRTPTAVHQPPPPPTPAHSTPVHHGQSPRPFASLPPVSTPSQSRASPAVTPGPPIINEILPSIQVQIPVTPSARQLPLHVPQTPEFNGLSPSVPPATPGNSQVLNSIVINPPQDLDRSQYIKHEKLDQRLKKSKPNGSVLSSKNRKRKRSHSDAADDEPILAGVDQRARAEKAVRDLQSLLNSVFEAEDGLQADTSGKSAGYEFSKYWLSGTPSGSRPCLSTAWHIKLESAVRHVISLRRFVQMTTEDIIRLQKLCEGSLRNAEEVRIVPSGDLTGSEIEEWLTKVGVVDNALKAGKTILRTMLGGRDEKQVYSEDILASIINLVKHIAEDELDPMIEMRAASDKSSIFKAAVSQKKILGGLLHEVTNFFGLLNELLEREEVTETAITSIEFVAVSIVFVENARDEKDSIFGVQRVEKFRVAAMDILGTIFARYPDQQSFLIGEILTRLEKLPVNRVSARQFKLLDGGKNIQLVSALIMRLVQISGTYQPRKKDKEMSDDEDEATAKHVNGGKQGTENNPEVTLSKLDSICRPLVNSAQKSAQSIIHFIVGRAMRSTKTGDEPYRNLLDIFTEDFLAVLGSPEWPGAELLLRNLQYHMISIVNDGSGKQPVTAKAMALDLLGLMGSGICDVTVYLRDCHKSHEAGETADDHIAQLIGNYLEAGSSGGDTTSGAEFEEELLDWDGPFRIVLEHLRNLMLQDHSLRSSHGYFLTLWSSRNCALFDAYRKQNDSYGSAAQEVARVATNLRSIALNGEPDDEDDFDLGELTSARIKQAYALSVLKMPFCSRFESMLLRLLRSIEDNQATTRSKGLKAFTQLLANDPSILNRPNVIATITRKSADMSALVRDSAIDLLSKCIALKPELQDEICLTILERTADTGVQVRKRCLKILKDIYLKTQKSSLKVQIAEALVLRIKDIDSGVAELARKTFEDIWITPFYHLVGDVDDDRLNTDMAPKTKLLVNEKVAVIVKVVQKENMLATMHDVIKSILQEDNKNAERNFKVCKTMVRSMFEDLLGYQEESDKADRHALMQALTVFARANPSLFTPDQLMMLQPYIENLTTRDDLRLFTSVIIIYRFALPILTNRQSDFLREVLHILMKNLSKLPARELREVISCMWTICVIIEDFARLIAVSVSCVSKILEAKGKPIGGDTEKAKQLEIRKLSRTVHIIGLLGHFCDFEEHIQQFKTKFPQWKGDTVSGLITDTVIPFCAATIDFEVRKSALEAVGHVCQTHPAHFLKPDVFSIFDEVFASGKNDFVQLVLQGLKGFLAREESLNDIAEVEGGATNDKIVVDGAPGRLTQAAYANQNDGVSTSLSQKYLQNIVEIATASQDQYALVAMEVIGSILRQGLVHPKECVPALVALETSTDTAISTIAFKEHKTLHAKHESIVERGYMDGVRKCFEYQRTIVGDSAGAILPRHTPKLRPLYDILKDGNKKVKKKFLANITASIDFDIVKLDIDASPNHLNYVKFVIENLAFLEYGAIDEVYQVVTAMEKVVAGTGTTIAHHIETEIFHIKIDDQQNPAEKIIDPQKLKIYSAGAGILSMVWATRAFLRKVYGVNEAKYRDYRAGKIKAPDLNKTASRNGAVKDSNHWEHIQATIAGLEDDGGRMVQCREFVESLNIDSEFKLAAEDTEVAEGVGSVGENTPELSDGGASTATPATPSGKAARKRKGSADTPTKTTKRKKPSAKRRASSKSLDRD